MSSMGSLVRAVSGMAASQRGLQVTGQNLSNVNTPGYVRQQLLQKDSSYMKIGVSGNDLLAVGLGTDISEIRQIRDTFLDLSYRGEVSKQAYYGAQQKAVEELENIFGEINGEGLGEVMTDLWSSITELSKHPDGLEARGMFVQSAVAFVNKANNIAEQMERYQYNLNTQIKDRVQEVNQLAIQIRDLNDQIAISEASGDHANDYRDERNNYLDRLSQLIDIEYHEDSAGRVSVLAEGHVLVSDSYVAKMGWDQTLPKSPFVKPVWQDTKTDVFHLDRAIGPEYDNDKGELKGLLMVRGDQTANWIDAKNETVQEKEHYAKDIEPYVLTKVQAQFDTLVHNIVTMINDVVAPYDQDTLSADPNAPKGLEGSQHIEIFSRKDVDRYDELDQYNAEETGANADTYADWVDIDRSTLYSAGNLMINPEILEDYNKIALSVNEDKGDNQIVEQILTNWSSPSTTYNQEELPELSYQDYYAEFIAGVGTIGYEVSKHVDNQQVLVQQIENQRQAMSGVSLDEEMGNMMKYQHAYNASARVISTVDTMIDTIVNRMGVVGR